MAKLILFCAVFAVLTGCFRLLPKSYFKRYKKIEAHEIKCVDTRTAYMVIGDFNQHFSKKFNRAIYNTELLFLYKNHLSAHITLPRKIAGEHWALDTSSFFSLLKKGIVDSSSALRWEYFTCGSNFINVYSAIYWGDNVHILNPGYVNKRRINITNYGLLSFHNRKLDDSIAIKVTFQPISNTLKPDSSTSNFYCRYKSRDFRFRREYLPKHPKYFNPCKDLKK